MKNSGYRSLRGIVHFIQGAKSSLVSTPAVPNHCPELKTNFGGHAVGSSGLG
jgi:hypothetical protein